MSLQLPLPDTTHRLVHSRAVREEVSVRLYPNGELRQFFRDLISTIEVSSRGTGKMIINFSQFSPVSIDWRDSVK